MTDAQIPNEAWMVDYTKFAQTLCGLDYATAAKAAREWLHYDWEECYMARTPYPLDVLNVDRGLITYCIDFRFDPDIRFVKIPPEEMKKEGRVVVSFGLSSHVTSPRPSSAGIEMQGFVGRTEKYFGKDYDKGHFVSHRMGGEVNWNLFPQLRSINRGWSEAGKRYRKMEQFCETHPGLFFFSRPIYWDFTCRPSALEYGILRRDLTFWVEIFPNIPSGQ